MHVAEGDKGSDKGSDLGLTIRRIVGIVAIVVGVPMLMRYCSHDDALQRISADSSRALGDQDDAVARYNGLIASDPNNAALYAGRGDSYRQKGDLDRAFADLDKAISLDPRLWEARLARCQAWRARNEVDRAIADCEEAARLKPDDPQAVALVGRMLAERGDADAARQKLDAAIALQPQGSGLLDSRFYRGQIALFHQNRPADAAQDFSVVLDRAFDYRETSKMLNGRDSTPLMAYQHPFVPDAFYLVMWLHIARVRASQADAVELGDIVKKLTAAMSQSNPLLEFPPKPEREVLAETLRYWPGRFIALYLGRLDADTIRPAAEAEPDPSTRRRRICDVDFYLGLYALEKGSTDAAQKLLQSAADNCPASAPEAGFAKSELARIKS
jgi:tetratricopeptide (TPR) repeat protein